MNKITLKTTGTQSTIYFGHSQASVKWPEKRKYRDFKVSFKLVHIVNLNSLKHWIFSKI